MFLGIAALGVVLIGFQNCAKTNFKEATETTASLKTEDMSSLSTPTLPTTDATPTPDTTPVPTPTTSPSPSPSLTPTPTPTPVVQSTPDTSASIVECDLKRPNSKVIYSSSSLGVGSNAKASRACMSEKACLSLINDYASVRNCSLLPGAPSTAKSASQCTAIFPGSKGTCKNAKVLTDAEVTDLLTKMAATK
jgi:hypothetical protein